jgi:putative DNA primase/helicase
MKEEWKRSIEVARAVPVEAEIARRGIKLRGSIDRCGPCPRCGGTDRFSINIRKQCFNCRSFGGGGVIRMVQHLDGHEDFIKAVRTLTDGRFDTPVPKSTTNPPNQRGAYEREQHRKAARMWSRRRPISQTPAEHYLRQPRLITCSLPPTLAYLPPLRPEHHPALIGAFGLAKEVEPGILREPPYVDAVHLVLLKSDGSDKAYAPEEEHHGKRNKITIASPSGLPIVVAPITDLMGLVICEGVEDALSAHSATGLGAWAAGSAPMMPALAAMVRDIIECVTIYAHADQSGRDGALGLAEALCRRNIEVRIEGLR